MRRYKEVEEERKGFKKIYQSCQHTEEILTKVRWQKSPIMYKMVFCQNSDEIDLEL